MDCERFLARSQDRSWYPSLSEFTEAWATATPDQRRQLAALHPAWAGLLDLDYAQTVVIDHAPGSLHMPCLTGQRNPDAL